MGIPTDDELAELSNDAFDAITKEVGVRCDAATKRKVCAAVTRGLIKSVREVALFATMPEDRRNIVLSMAADNVIRKHIYASRPDLAPS